MLRSILLLAVLAPVVASQGALGSPVDLVADATVSRGPAGLFAVGPDYLARFGTEGVTFLPSRGDAATVEGDTRFTLAAVGREGALVACGDEVAPRVDGLQLSYERAAGVTERWEARDEGLYLDVVVAERPAGTGDLVVRFAVESALEPVPVGDALHFVDVEGSGLRVGSVLGVDADGRRASGGLRAVEGGLELVLPAAFVDAARFPLVVDPPIGTISRLATGGDDRGPDAAYDVSHDEYLVVWERTISASTRAILARRVAGPSGLPLGPVLVLRQQSNIIARNVRVASSDQTDRFGVAWEERYVLGSPFRIVVAAVDAGSGFASTHATVHASSNAQGDVAVSGSRGTVAASGMLVAWDEEGVGIHVERVELGTGGAPSTFATPALAGAETLFQFVSQPALSQSGGETGVSLLTYTSSSLFSSSRILGRAVSSTGGLLDAGPTQLTPASTTWPAHGSTCDGDGTRWLVAWEQELGTPPQPYPGTVVVEWDGTALSHGSAGATTYSSDPEDTSVDLGFAGVDLSVQVQLYRAGFEAVTVGTHRMTPNGDCNRDHLVSGVEAFTVAVTTEYAGGGSPATQAGLVVWDRLWDASQSSVYAQLYRTTGNGVNQAGGCGPGGEIRAPCVYDGSSTILWLYGAGPSAPAFLAYSRQLATDGVCGSCVLRPALGPGFTIVPAGTTSSTGNLGLSVPVPLGTEGFDVTLQWLTFHGSPVGACPAFGSVALSNAVTVTVL